MQVVVQWQPRSLQAETGHMRASRGLMRGAGRLTEGRGRSRGRKVYFDVWLELVGVALVGLELVGLALAGLELVGLRVRVP